VEEEDDNDDEVQLFIHIFQVFSSNLIERYLTYRSQFPV
jgi:hypothetical protein